MAEQLSLVVLFVALASGLVTSIATVTYMQSRQPEFFRYFLTNILLFNLFPLVWIKWFRPLQAVSGQDKFELLGITRREKEIIRQIQAGKTNQEIADLLFISVATVKDHNHNLFKKSGVRNRLELANLFR